MTESRAVEGRADGTVESAGEDRMGRIRQLLRSELEAAEIQLEDDSASHGRGGAQTHLRLLVVSDRFLGLSAVERHRAVYRLLAAEFQGGLHACAIQALAPDEWSGQAGRPPPPCAGPAA